MNIRFVILILAFVLCSTSVWAAPCPYDVCTTDSFTLDWVGLTPDFEDLGGIPDPYSSTFGTWADPYQNLLSQAYNATSCVGAFVPPANDGGLSETAVNIGHLGDGLLNGQLAEGGIIGQGDIEPTFTQIGDDEPNYFTGQEFTNDMQALGYLENGNIVSDNIYNDPGWIHLGGVEGVEELSGEGISYDTAGKGIADIGDLYIGDLLTLSFTMPSDSGVGTWTLTTHPDVIAQAQALLGEATFDHLAFSIKAGNTFVVYDFDFKEIFALEDNPYLNFLTPYELSGVFDTSDFCDKDVSHFDVWARDPSDDITIVPEPSTFILLGIGLLGLGLYARRLG